MGSGSQSAPRLDFPGCARGGWSLFACAQCWAVDFDVVLVCFTTCEEFYLSAQMLDPCPQRVSAVKIEPCYLLGTFFGREFYVSGATCKAPSCNRFCPAWAVKTVQKDASVQIVVDSDSVCKFYMLKDGTLSVNEPQITLKSEAGSEEAGALEFMTLEFSLLTAQLCAAAVSFDGWFVLGRLPNALIFGDKVKGAPKAPKRSLGDDFFNLLGPAAAFAHFQEASPAGNKENKASSRGGVKVDKNFPSHLLQ